MGIERTCVCDKCRKVVSSSRGGVIIKGNMYTASASDPLLLTDNNIPEPSGFMDPPMQGPMRFTEDEITESVFCNSCLFKMLGFHIKDH